MFKGNPALLSDADWARVNAGSYINIAVTVDDVTKSVDAQTKADIATAAEGYTVGSYLGIGVVKTTVNYVEGQLKDVETVDIHQLNDGAFIAFEVALSGDMVNTDPNKTRTYKVIARHVVDGAATCEVVDAAFDAESSTLTFSADEFSTFAIAYFDTDIAPETVAVPTAAEGLVYTGSEQTGVAAGAGYTLSGTAAATDAGTYVATATLEQGFAWADGTTDPKTIEWSIAKAPQAALAFDCADTVKAGDSLALAVTGGSGTGDVTFTVANGTGQARIEDGKLVGVAAGEVSVTATKAGDANHEGASITATFKVTKQDEDVTPEDDPDGDDDSTPSGKHSSNDGSSAKTPSTGDMLTLLIAGLVALVAVSGAAIALIRRRVIR